MKRLFLATLGFLVVSDATAEVPFKEHPNGDLTVKIVRLTKRHIAELERDIRGNQGKCVRFQILEFQEYEMEDAVMRIPAERHGIEFESRGDGLVTFACGRFAEDWYDGNGQVERSIEYEGIEGY